MYKPLKLKDIIAANPGISIPDAVQKLNAHNAAAAMAASKQQSTDVFMPLSQLSNPSVTGPTTVTSSAQVSTTKTPEGTALDPGDPEFAAKALKNAAELAKGMAAPGPVQKTLVGVGLKPARELYVGNLPPGVNTMQLNQFLDKMLHSLGVCGPEGTVISSWINDNGHFAFVEFRTIEESNSALVYLSGMMLGQYQLKVGRPRTMGPGGPPVPPDLHSTLPASSALSMGNLPGGLSVIEGGDPSNCLLLTNLPVVIQEEQVKELVSPFGKIKAFNLIMDPKGTTKSAAFEYEDSSVIDGAVSGLNGLPIIDNKLSVIKVPASTAQALLAPAPKAAVANASDTTTELLKQMPKTRVLRMSNMVTEDDLKDDEEYEGLKEDILDECNNHGSVRSLVVPRPSMIGEDIDCPGKGHIFVQFSNQEGAEKTKNAVSGRTFGGIAVVVYYYPETLFVKEVYELTEGFKPGPDIFEEENTAYKEDDSAAPDLDVADMD